MRKWVEYGFLGIILAMFGYVALNMGGSTYQGIGEAIVNAVEKTNSYNVVTAVVFDFRGYDTIGESFVLFTAITAAAAILRKPLKKKEKEV